MTVVARRIASVPARTAVETWERILELVTAPQSPARDELMSITSVAAMLIADEQTKDAAITIAGGGPLVRLYTVHADDAIEHDDADEAVLPFDPTTGENWRLSLPATGGDVAIVKSAVADYPHIEVIDLDAIGDSDEGDSNVEKAADRTLELDLKELERS